MNEQLRQELTALYTHLLSQADNLWQQSPYAKWQHYFAQEFKNGLEEE